MKQFIKIKKKNILFP